MAEGEDLQHCYNKGCGQRFNPKENANGACKFHPGPVVFHDAYKGCTEGEHNPVKPAEADRPYRPQGGTDGAAEADPALQPSANGHAAPIGAVPRRAADRSLAKTAVDQRLRVKCAEFHRKTIEDKVAQLKEEQLNKPAEEDPSLQEVSVGTNCKNPGCNRLYEGVDSLTECCWYHNGVPIFHEGMKFWSCCQRKTSDFDNFLSQEGCTSGKHAWSEKDCLVKKRAQCRYDWVQTGSSVVITVYAKGALPDSVSLLAGPVTLAGEFDYSWGETAFPVDFSLWGAIDPIASSVTVTPTKVEIDLRKADAVSWPRLNYVQELDNPDGQAAA